MENLKYAEILKLNKHLSKAEYDFNFSAKILSNVTVNPFKEILEYSLRVKKINPIIEIGNFDNIVQDSLNAEGHNIVFIFYDILNIIDNISDYFESLDENSISDLEQKLKSEIDLTISNLKNTPTIIFNTFCSYSIVSPFVNTTKLEKTVNNLNNHLLKVTAKNLVLVNVDKIIAELGRAQAFDYRFYQSSKAPYTISFFKTYTRAIESTILKVTGRIKKVLVFDCDNTLWKGVVGEDGPDNIQMSFDVASGKAFYDVQNIAKYLSNNGILIGLCSKNNLSDVEEVIRTHKSMVLSNENIIIKKVNWSDKASNLLDIASELNIGVESLLFVDDSDYEINLIKERLPGLRTLKVPKNSYLYKNELLSFIYENTSYATTDEDFKKNSQYKDQLVRDNHKKQFSSLDTYLSSLEIKLNICIDNEVQVPRISQLTQKTNQFNLTTYRYSETEIEEFVKSNKNHVFTASVSDKFGDSGLTLVCIVLIDNIDNASAVIDSFLMSCRVIGRNIEFAFMNQLFKILKQMGIKRIQAKYIKSSKNQQVEHFYEKLGFGILMEDDSSKNYFLGLDELNGSTIDYIKISNNFKL